MKMIKYIIKQRFFNKPEIELPDNSQVVSVKYHDTIMSDNFNVEAPGYWQVIWIEPKIE